LAAPLRGLPTLSEKNGLTNHFGVATTLRMAPIDGVHDDRVNSQQFVGNCSRIVNALIQIQEMK
jgi:hypothetical protein